MKSSCTIVDSTYPTGKGFQPLEGKRFERFLVLSYAGRDKSRNKMWNCRCDCGSHRVVAGGDLKSGHRSSCGCLKDERTRVRNATHGCNRVGKTTAEYKTWAGIKRRCLNKNEKAYPRYGGRGVTICDRWRDSFENFLEDMGPKPQGTSIDRIDNNGNYEPGNCRWATKIQQARNTRRRRVLTLWGVTGIVVEVAEFWGICPRTLKDRYYRNNLHLYGPNPPLPPCNKGL